MRPRAKERKVFLPRRDIGATALLFQRKGPRTGRIVGRGEKKREGKGTTYSKAMREEKDLKTLF